MNYRDLQNISYLSQHILTESAYEEHDAMNRWPYASPYLQEERAEGAGEYSPGMGGVKRTGAEVRAQERTAEKNRRKKGADKPGYSTDDKKFAHWTARATPASTLKRKKKEGGTEEETVSQRMDREKPYGKRMTGPMAREYGSRHAAEVTRVVKGAGEPQSVTYPRKKNESYDLYDLVLAHLIDEGYAETQESANAIMANMSEEWRDSIVEGIFDILPKSKGTTVPPDKRNPVEKYSDAAKPVFSGLPQGRTASAPKKP